MIPRQMFAVLLVVALAGISVCDVISRDWKTAILGGLFACCNIIIFLWR